LFRRLDGFVVPTLHRNLDVDPLALSAADHLFGAGARLLRLAWHSAPVLVGVAGWTGARRIPARAQFRIHPGGARARGFERHHHVPPSVAERHGRDHDIPAVHRVVLGDDADRARFPRFRIAAGLALAWGAAVTRQGEYSGAMARALRLHHSRVHALA